MGSDLGRDAWPCMVIVVTLVCEHDKCDEAHRHRTNAAFLQRIRLNPGTTIVWNGVRHSRVNVGQITLEEGWKERAVPSKNVRQITPEECEQVPVPSRRSGPRKVAQC